ncbi:hypothetical protein [Actinoallomurus sp. NPDC052274]|uniref:hypothetical protein n=1 Tax=Actinoallomurus sp. NPDC052274 TaxID=3155420 RepID=UPI00342A4FC7
MHAQDANTSPPIGTVKTVALRLAPLLERQGLNLAVSRDGIVEAHKPGDSRARQSLILRQHQGGLWWHWKWPGPTRESPPEYEPMVPAEDVAEAARRLANVLHVAEVAGAEQ